MTTDGRTLLFEIGTEELPSREVDSAVASLAAHIQHNLHDNRLAHGEIETYATPRRLAVIVHNVAAKASDLESLVLGPAARIAFDDTGQPTRAAIGFAKGKGLSPDALQRVETPKGEYVAVTVKDEGRNAQDILEDVLSASFKAIRWKRTMRWGWGEVQFARPVRWIVALLDDTVIPVTFGQVTASNKTRGHRFLAPAELPLTKPADYLASLRNAYVMASVEERREVIEREVKRIAEDAGLTALVDPDLVSEVVHLVEWPVAMLGRFDKQLLEVPREVLIVSMRTHQRYFPAESVPGTLANAFIFISNMVVEDPQIIIKGNLRVLRARLEDARFFWNEDLRVSLESFRDKLASIRYIDGIGSVCDRSDRIAAVAAKLVDDHHAGDAQLRQDVVRAASLAKCDLATGMVGEFSELQGVMGRYYASHDGENDAVSAAIDEHYMPRGSADDTAPSLTGAIVAIAEKLDAITGCFALGLVPSGSADPYALRRAAIGLLRTAIAHGLRLDLPDLIGFSWDQHPADKLRARDAVIADADAFIRGRMPALLPDTPTDIAQAIIATLGSDLPSLYERARVLTALRANEDFEPLAAGFKRVVNIVSKAASENDVVPQALREPARLTPPDPTLFTQAEENALWEALQGAKTQVDAAAKAGDFSKMAQTLIALKAPIDAFFEGVLVNDEDPKIRNNRLMLLATLQQVFLTFADISLIQ